MIRIYGWKHKEFVDVHPVIAILLIHQQVREVRWACMAKRREKEEYRRPHNIEPWEVPASGSLSGWMRNGREADEYARLHKGEWGWL